MNKKIICSIAVVFMLSLVVMPVSGAINITKDGEDRLYGWVINLKKRKESIEKFIKIYERR